MRDGDLKDGVGRVKLVRLEGSFPGDKEDNVWWGQTGKSEFRGKTNVVSQKP